MFILFWLQNESNLPICQWVSEEGVVVHCICEILFGLFFSPGTEKVEKCKFCVNSVFSLTWPASMQIYWNKKSVYIRKEFNSHRTGLGTNMAAVSLFLDPNMATVTSCENTQYIHESRSQKQTFCRTFSFHMSSCFRRTATLCFFNILRRHSLHILQFTICLVILWLSTISNSLREKLQAKHQYLYKPTKTLVFKPFTIYCCSLMETFRF